MRDLGNGVTKASSMLVLSLLPFNCDRKKNANILIDTNCIRLKIWSDL